MGPAGFEPATKGLCTPLRFSPPLSGLWSGPSLQSALQPTVCRLVSTPSVVTPGSDTTAWLGIGVTNECPLQRSPSLTDSTADKSRNPIGEAIQKASEFFAKGAENEFPPGRLHHLSPLL